MKFFITLVLFYVNLIAGTSAFGGPSIRYRIVESNDALNAPVTTFESGSIELPTALNFGFESRPIWIEIDAIGVEAGDQFLAIEHPLLGNVEVYKKEGDKVSRIGQSGTLFIPNGVALTSRNPLFAIPAGVEKMLVRVQTDGSAQVPISIMNARDTIYRQSMESTLFGAYYGIIGIMLVYNLLLAVLTRRRVYAWYVFYVASYLIFQAALNGFLASISSAPRGLTNFCITFFGGVTFTFILQFFRTLVELSGFPRLNWVSRFLAISCTLLALSSLWLPYRFMVQAVVVNSYIVAIFLFMASVHLAFKKIANAQIFAVAWTVFLVGIVILGLKNHGIISTNLFATYAVQVGSVFEIALLAIYLGSLIKRETMSRQNAEERNLATRMQLRETAAIAQTTQMLAHDVRKPFSMLRMALSMLGNAKDPAAVKAVMSRIVPDIDKAMTSVDGMICDVMEVGSASTNLIQEPASPDSLIEATLGEVVRMYPDANISFSYDLKHTHMANVHVQKMGRVFSNIVGNAFQAMRNKGQMWFKTSESDGMITFCIGNGGSVIPAESLPKLFDAFFTSGKKGGTGLGLAIAQKVVNAHGGKIWCESSKSQEHPEGKVEFFFTLPIATDRLNKTTAILPSSSSEISKQLVMLTNSAPASLSIDKGDLSLEEDIVEAHKLLGRQLRVLIIDDEAIYRSALAAHLTRTPELESALAITQGGNSNDALKASPQGDFDLVITDVDMGPDSLDGFELVHELRRLGSKSLICVHSNRIVAADNKTAIESGADNFMPKPMARAQLLRIVLQAASAAKNEQKLQMVSAADLKPNVLVVDDASLVIYAWESALSEDTNLITMRSFEELQDKIASDPYFIQSLHYVVTDMHLDGSQGDGLDVGRVIKSLRPDLRILMSSNDIFDPHELVGAVDKLIAKEAVGIEELRALASS